MNTDALRHSPDAAFALAHAHAAEAAQADDRAAVEAGAILSSAIDVLRDESYTHPDFWHRDNARHIRRLLEIYVNGGLW